MKRKALALALALALAAAGLAGRQYYLDHIKLPETGPSRVVERYFEAIKLKDYEKAYALVSRRHYPDSFNQFVDRVNMYSPDMSLTINGESLEENAAFVEIDIIVPMAFGPYAANTRMALARVKREWKIIHP
ncbi:MAG: DUF4829 domain-containing protein [Candidatus Adiutrix sp.]|jgi:hypothetical protein|nr:DUF4829 domain-containing protein [Candidatus Adiutrix sp.]